jgi:hypothetical protein
LNRTFSRNIIFFSPFIIFLKKGISASAIRRISLVDIFRDHIASILSAQISFLIRKEGEPCKVTDRKEVCLAIGNMAEMTIAGDVGRQIS